MILTKDAREVRVGKFLGEFTVGAGMAKKLFSGFLSLAGSGVSGIAPQEPRTEYHPSFSGCSGRSPSPGCNPSGLPWSL